MTTDANVLTNDRKCRSTGQKKGQKERDGYSPVYPPPLETYIILQKLSYIIPEQYHPDKHCPHSHLWYLPPSYRNLPAEDNRQAVFRPLICTV